MPIGQMIEASLEQKLRYKPSCLRDTLAGLLVTDVLGVISDLMGSLEMVLFTLMSEEQHMG